ncbi:MAG: HD-GYP domain-containing protein [Thermotogae bacterium]|nr:HD-GYP domain-containing protein [Thermotogota bacterium]
MEPIVWGVIGFLFALLLDMLVFRGVFIERRCRKIEDINRRFIDALENISNLASCDISDEEFLDRSLNSMSSFFADVGEYMLSIFEEGKWNVVSTKGKNIHRFRNLKFREEDFTVPKDTKFLSTEVEALKYLPSRIVREFLTSGNRGAVIIIPLRFFENAEGILILRKPYVRMSFQLKEELKMAHQLARIIASFYSMRRLLKRMGKFHKSVAIAFTRAMELYSVYTKGHSERVARYATTLGEKMGLSRETIRRLFWAALLHDIGKIGVPLYILEKPGNLEGGEYELVKKHTVWGWEILNQIEGMAEIAKIVRHHHERYDGRGYPDGLMGEEIPLEARIIAVVDSFDAMKNDTPYRKALRAQEILKELVDNKGKQFDPMIVEMFLELLKKDITMLVKREN